MIFVVVVAAVAAVAAILSHDAINCRPNRLPNAC